MKILGISAFYHDSAAALIEDGVLISAAQEERFTRVKHDESFPVNAVIHCLKSNSLELADLDAVVFYDKPFLKFERIISTALNNAPKGLLLFLRSIPVWLKKKLLLKGHIRKQLRTVSERMGTTEDDGRQLKLLFSSHHMSHAASAFYCSPFETSAILTVDGVGEYATASIGIGKGTALQLVKELHFPHSLGLLYSSFTYFLGFQVNEGEYKVMGLAPYSDPESESVLNFKKIILDQLVSICKDGSIILNDEAFIFEHAFRMVSDKKWTHIFGVERRRPDEPLSRVHADIAQALQLVTEEVLLQMAFHAREITGMDRLCMAGGVALNCVANGKLYEKHWFRNIFIQPAAGDAGGALGAALAAYHLHFDRERKVNSDYMSGGSVGPEYSDVEIYRALERNKHTIEFEGCEEGAIIARTADAILEGKVIGWFQGGMEFGPRALGHRSILADASRSEMQSLVNLKVKKRESFRPFAPILLEEEVFRYFENGHVSEYMLYVHKLKPEFRKAIPDDYYSMPLGDMLRIDRSPFPSISHIDYSSRLQTVPESSSKRILKLLHAIKDRTGTGMLINTSFNVKGEPIVCTPQDAINCFLLTDIDILVIGNYWAVKT